MTERKPTRFPRPAPPFNEGVLARWIDAYASTKSLPPERLRRTLAFELLTAAMTRDSDPTLVIKGGFALELRLGLRARATQDIDAMLRAGGSVEEIDAHVRELLAPTLLDGAISFEVRSARPIGTTGAVRFDIRVKWKQRSFAKVKLEVSDTEGSAGEAWDAVPGPDIAAQFAVDLGGGVTVPCLPLRYQIAQKIHAVTDDHEANDRFRDLIDLLLLDDVHGQNNDHILRDTCLEIFTLRDRHEWPPTVTGRPGWEAGYRSLAAEMKFPIAEAADAVEEVRRFILRIDGGR